MIGCHALDGGRLAGTGWATGCRRMGGGAAGESTFPMPLTSQACPQRRILTRLAAAFPPDRKKGHLS
jgi:hypothetical protein